MDVPYYTAIAVVELWTNLFRTESERGEMHFVVKLKFLSSNRICNFLCRFVEENFVLTAALYAFETSPRVKIISKVF